MSRGPRDRRGLSLGKGSVMTLKGGCCCGELRYRAEGDPLFPG